FISLKMSITSFSFLPRGLHKIGNGSVLSRMFSGLMRPKNVRISATIGEAPRSALSLQSHSSVTMLPACQLQPLLPATFSNQIRCLTAGSDNGNIVAIQDLEDFDKRVRNAADSVALVQFHATWCAPCKLLKPRLEKAVRPRPKLLLATVDVDDVPDLAEEFRVASVPMVLAMRSGRVVDSFVGLKEPEALQDFVDGFAEKQGL
ncbi:hypothetical protein BOX15_Mlig012916g1, partial [Macrostomum lignano]